MTLEKLIDLSRCHAEGGTFVEFQGRELAVFRFSSPQRVIVIDNTCPHAAGNLSGGEVDGSIVTCPSHNWQFDLETGICTHADKARVKRYPAEIRDGAVWVDVEGRFQLDRL